MTTKEYIETLVKNMKAYCKDSSYINMGQFADFMGISRDYARIMLYKTPFVKVGREKKYLIEEVATCVEIRRTLAWKGEVQ